MQTQKTLSITENIKKKINPPAREYSQKKCFKSTGRFSENICESDVDGEILLDQNVDRHFTDDHLDDEDLENVISYYDLPSMWAENLDEFNNATTDAAIVKEHENYLRNLHKFSLTKLLSVKPSNPPTIKKIEKVQYDLTNLRRKKDVERTDKPTLTNARKLDEEYEKMLVDDLNVSDYQGHSLRSSKNIFFNSNKNLEEIQKQKSKIQGGHLQNAELNSQLQSRLSRFDMNNIHNKNDIEMDNCKKQTSSTQFVEKSDQFSEYFQEVEQESSRTILSPKIKFQNLNQSPVTSSPSHKSVKSKDRESSEERRKKIVNEILEKNGFNLKSFYDSPFVKSIMSEENDNILNNNDYDDNVNDYDPRFEVVDGSKMDQMYNQPKSSVTDPQKNISTKQKSKVESVDGLNINDQSNLDRYDTSKVPSSDPSKVESNQSLRNNYKNENFFDKIPSATYHTNPAEMKKFEKVQDNSMHSGQNNEVEQIDQPIAEKDKKFEEEYQKMLVDELNVSEYGGQSLFSNLDALSKNTENLKEIQTQQSEIPHSKLDQVSKDRSLSKRSEFYENNICIDDVEMKICKKETSSLSEIIEKPNEEKLNLKELRLNKDLDVRSLYNSQLAKTFIDENESPNKKNVNCNSQYVSSKIASSQQGSKLESRDLIFNQSRIHSSGTSKSSSHNSSKKLKINQNFDSNNKNLNFFDVPSLSIDSQINFEGSINRKLLQARKSPACNSNDSVYKVKNAQESKNFFDVSQITANYSDKFESSLNRKLLQPHKLPTCSFNSMTYKEKNSQESKKSVKKHFEKDSVNNSRNFKFNTFNKQSYQKTNSNESLQASNFSFNEKDISDESPVKSTIDKNEYLMKDVPMTEELIHFSSPDLFDSYERENSFSLLEKHKSDNFSNSSAKLNNSNGFENSKFNVQREQDFMSVISESSDESD